MPVGCDDYNLRVPPGVNKLKNSFEIIQRNEHPYAIFYEISSTIIVFTEKRMKLPDSLIDSAGALKNIAANILIRSGDAQDIYRVY